MTLIGLLRKFFDPVHHRPRGVCKYCGKEISILKNKGFALHHDGADICIGSRADERVRVGPAAEVGIIPAESFVQSPVVTHFEESGKAVFYETPAAEVAEAVIEGHLGEQPDGTFKVERIEPGIQIDETIKELLNGTSHL